MSGINAKRENRIKGIVDRISSEDDFDSIKWITQAPVQNFCRSAVDEIAQKNAELHNDMGLEAKIVRQTVGENCKWCDALAGEYVYPDVPKEVYQRHDDCDCIVEYMPGDGRVQNVWSKQWTEAPEDLEARKDYNLPQDVQIELKKIKEVLSPAEYKEFVEIIQQPGNEDFLRAFTDHADEISEILKKKGAGVFSPSRNTIEFDLATEEGRHAFGILVHEYGHFFDHTLKNDAITFKERDAIVEALFKTGKFSENYLNALFPKDLSQSDQFLEAVRAGKAGVKLTKEQIAELVNSGGTRGIQDTLDGMFGRRNIGVRWGHGERYYKLIASALKDRRTGLNGIKDVKAAINKLGYKVTSQKQAEAMLRDHMTAIEMWANMSSDAALSTEGAELFAKLFPDAYNVFKEIMKNAY